MNKAEFIAQVAKRGGMTKKDAEKAADAVFETLAALLAAGDKINLPGFGAFETRLRSARTCRNIHTGAPSRWRLPGCRYSSRQRRSRRE